MVYLFKSTRDVIKAEKALGEKKFSCKIIPVPRSISTECGMGIESSKELEKEIDTLLTRLSIEFKKYYEYKK